MTDSQTPENSSAAGEPIDPEILRRAFKAFKKP
jgi:hypothetical protein